VTLIAHLDGGDRHHADAQDLLKAARKLGLATTA